MRPTQVQQQQLIKSDQCARQVSAVYQYRCADFQVRFYENSTSATLTVTALPVNRREYKTPNTPTVADGTNVRCHFQRRQRRLRRMY